MMKQNAVIVSTIWIIILLSVNVCAAGELLSLEGVVKQALANPPSSSKLNMYHLQLDRPDVDGNIMVYPTVGIEVTNDYSGDSGLNLQCRVSGDLSDYLLLSKRREYNKLLAEQYEANKAAAGRDLIYSVLYPYLMLAELTQTKKIMQGYQDLFTTSIEQMQKNVAENRVDPVYYQQALIYKTKYDLLVLENSHQYAEMQRELANLLQIADAQGIAIGDDLAAIRKEYDLSGTVDTGSVPKMLANDPELHASKLSLEISKLNMEVKNLEITVPDLRYSLNGQYTTQAKGSWGWNISASWNFEEFLHGSKLDVSANDNNYRFSFELNNNQTGTTRSKDEALLTNSNNLNTQTYKMTSTYQRMVDSYTEALHAMELIKVSRQLIDEQLKRIQGMAEGPQKTMDVMRLTLDYLNMEKSYYSQSRDMMFLELQIKIAAGDLVF